MRNNSVPILALIPRLQARGLWVVAEWRGLDFVGYTTHDNEADAIAHSSRILARPMGRAKIFDPIGDTVITQVGAFTRTATVTPIEALPDAFNVGFQSRYADAKDPNHARNDLNMIVNRHGLKALSDAIETKLKEPV